MVSSLIAALSVFIHTQGKKFVTVLSHFLYMWASDPRRKNDREKFSPLLLGHSINLNINLHKV